MNGAKGIAHDTSPNEAQGMDGVGLSASASAIRLALPDANIHETTCEIDSVLRLIECYRLREGGIVVLTGRRKSRKR